MTWPVDRLTTYAPGTQVKSADLNALQDAIIAGKYGEIDVHVNPLLGDYIVGSRPTIGVSSVTAVSNPNNWIIPIGLPVGAVIDDIEVDYDRSGGGTMVMQLVSVPYAGSGATVHASLSDGASVSRAQGSLTSTLPHTIADNAMYYVNVAFNGVGNDFYGFRLRAHNP